MFIAGTPLSAQGFAGKIVDESGKPLGGVAVDYVRVPKKIIDPSRGSTHLMMAPGESLKRGTVQSHADGTFSATSSARGCLHPLCPPAERFVRRSCHLE